MLDPLPSPPPTAAALRSADATAYDAAQYGRHIDYTPKALIIDGVPRVIVSAEFHYFRVPDRARWRQILTSLRGAGFNAVRLYFYWGYHSPSEDKLDFSGNRDIDYLLRLCTELELFVIPAPGPYICAEVQGGGFPLWLIAKRELRIRHLTLPPIGLHKRWDQAFHDHCSVYMRAILAILVPHERTTNPGGCVIALQIENELLDSIGGLIGGLDEELRLLADESRAAGSTVPLFHNDPYPAGSWAKAKKKRSIKAGFAKTGPPSYQSDLYGFDLYFTFPPGDKSGDRSSMQVGMAEAGGISAMLNCCGIGGAGVGGSDSNGLSCLFHDVTESPPPALQWAATTQMQGAVDSLESSFYRMGGSASAAPPFVAETQVGWINQWGRLRGYDENYNFFGDHFSSTLLVSLTAQGVTMTNHYMGYGGTNYGAVGDTEVYSSYDYSVFIREFGMLSARGRKMRLASLFVRSLANRGLANSDLLDGKVDKRSINSTQERVKTTKSGSLLSVRVAALPDDASAFGPSPSLVAQPPMFAFLRNLDGTSGRFNLIVDDVILPCIMPPFNAMIAPLYYPLGPAAAPTATVSSRAVPVVLLALHTDSGFWVLRTREAKKGRPELRLPERDSRRGLRGKVSTPSSTSGGSAVTGTSAPSDQDQGATKSLIGAPFEELGLDPWNPSADSAALHIAVRASTEGAGLCFSFAFADRLDACEASVRDSATASGAAPLVRSLCLSDSDADTFAADCGSDDLFVASPRPNIQSSPASPVSVVAAWGADEISVLPGAGLQVGLSAKRKSCVVVLCSPTSCPREFEHVRSDAMPGLFEHALPNDEVRVSPQPFSCGSTKGPPDMNFELALDGRKKRAVDWEHDVAWKDIFYSERDPLDHLMGSGHVAYRLRFRTKAQSLSMVVNIRHVSGARCNGTSCGSHIVHSHNVASAGAMHAIDLHQAGKQRHTLTTGMTARSKDSDGFHEVVILVLSFGQSRSQFLLNDIGNKRGLLSAILMRRATVSDVSWAIAGLDVRDSYRAHEATSLPIEELANDRTATVGFEDADCISTVPNDGVVYSRTTFKVPSCSMVGGNVRYPLRLRLDGTRRSVAILWVIELQIGRYVQAVGPQGDFHIPGGVIADVRLLPWVVDSRSGNLQADGKVFAVHMSSFCTHTSEARRRCQKRNTPLAETAQKAL